MSKTFAPGTAFEPCIFCESLDLIDGWEPGQVPMCVLCVGRAGREYALNPAPEPGWFTAAPKLSPPGYGRSYVRAQFHPNAATPAAAAGLWGWDVGRWCDENGRPPGEREDVAAAAARATAGLMPEAERAAVEAGFFAGVRSGVPS